MLPALAPLRELEARLGLDEGALVGADKARAQAALTDASALVRAEAGRSFLVDDTGAIDAPDAVVRVVLGAALRTYRNPAGEISQTVGPFSRKFARTETGVYLTEAERDIVRRYRLTRSELWTMPTTREPEESATIWAEDSFGSELFPIASTSEPWNQ